MRAIMLRKFTSAVSNESPDISPFYPLEIFPYPKPTATTNYRIEFNYRCADIYFVNYLEAREPNGRTSGKLVKNLILYDDSRLSQLL